MGLVEAVLGLAGDSVSYATHSFHHATRLTQSLTQAFDVHIHSTLFNEHMVAPHTVEQLATAVNALGVVHQVVEQLELRWAQFDALVIEAHAVR
jgi:UDP-3-O-acyl-N-acetylglucosamine deacetylase